MKRTPQDPAAASGRTLPSDRAKAVAAAESLLRLLRHMKDCFPEDDFETVAVYLTVATASAGHTLRNPALLVDLAGGPLPDDLQAPTSRRAIAAATGLPRETVRRKLIGLVASGRVVEDEGGVRIPTDTLHRDRNREFADRIISELAVAGRRIGQFDGLDKPDSAPRT